MTNQSPRPEPSPEDYQSMAVLFTLFAIRNGRWLTDVPVSKAIDVESVVIVFRRDGLRQSISEALDTKDLTLH